MLKCQLQAGRKSGLIIFWPDTPESEARRSLTHLLTRLRGALPVPDLLLISGDRVGLDLNRVSSDLVSFCQLSALSGGIEPLRRAADLYRGPFLAGFSLPGSPEFEAWVLEQQRDCERLYLGVLTALIKKYTARQEYDAAIACAPRYVATDELVEDVHRRLIAIYAATGNRSAAQRQFERCVAVLERELGVRPLPETRAVYESALEDRQSPTALPSTGSSAWPGVWPIAPGRAAPSSSWGPTVPRSRGA